MSTFNYSNANGKSGNKIENTEVPRIAPSPIAPPPQDFSPVTTTSTTTTSFISSGTKFVRKSYIPSN